MAKLGVVAVTNPYWFGKDDSAYTQTVAFVGKERAQKQYPMKSFFDKGVVVTQASDYPVTQVPNPLESIQFAVLRQIPGKPETLLNGTELGSITACAPEHITETKVLGKMIGGEWVYTREI